MGSGLAICSAVGQIGTAPLNFDHPRLIRSFILALACWVCVAPSMADVLLGRVVGVSDGDTITVIDDDQKTHKVRLSGIDAPEKAQAFGQQAKRQLSDWVFQKTVRVVHNKTDRYGRVVGKVMLDGEDVNLWMGSSQKTEFKVR